MTAEGGPRTWFGGAAREVVVSAEINADRKEHSMLAVTPTAAAAVATLLENSELPRSAGLRLQAGVDATGETAIGMAVVEAPEPEDELVPAAAEARLFVAPDVAALLDGQVLDAEIQDQQFAFTIRPQSVNGGVPAN
jgi:Fe-S cluster assembly iron-binding protein IscA